MTIPTIDWLSKLGSGGAKLASFSIALYGAQLDADTQFFPDAGNGLYDGGNGFARKIITNNKADASAPNSLTLQMGFLDYLQAHPASFAAVRYFTMDNEPDLWADTHRDVVRPDGGGPNGAIDPNNEGDKSVASVTRLVNFARLVKQRAPGAIVLAPETSSWFGYLVSAFDRQYANNRADNGDPNAFSTYPLDGDLAGGYRTVTAANPDGFYLPWLFGQLAAVAPTEGRLVDYFTAALLPADRLAEFRRLTGNGDLAQPLDALALGSNLCRRGRGGCSVVHRHASPAHSAHEGMGVAQQSRHQDRRDRIQLGAPTRTSTAALRSRMCWGFLAARGSISRPSFQRRTNSPRRASRCIGTTTGSIPRSARPACG